MAKSKRKTRKSTIVLFIITIITVIISSYFTINNINKYNDIKKDKKVLKKDINKIDDDYKVIKEAKDKISKELEDYKDIDSKIVNTKKDVFEKASEVEKKIQDKKTDYKIAYLTFDDGPYYLTDRVLEVLKEKQVKVTFFTIGAGKEKCLDKRSVSCMETYKKETDANHTVANHTYSHNIFNGLYSSVDFFMNQVDKQHNLIKEKTGVEPNIIRFPGGSVTAGKLKDGIAEKLREKGYGWVDWTCEDGDGRDLTSTNQAWNIFTSGIDEDIEVVLLHDYNTYTFELLPKIIDYLEEKNYILLPLFYESVMVNK